MPQSQTVAAECGPANGECASGVDVQDACLIQDYAMRHFVATMTRMAAATLF